MKYLFLAILCYSTISRMVGQSFDKAVIVNIRVDEASGLSHVLSADGRLLIEGPQFPLPPGQIIELRKILNDTATFGNSHATTPIPLIGIVFFKKGKVVDWLEIDFDANTLDSRHKIKAQDKYHYLLDQYKIPLTGLSTKGRKKLKHWITQTALKGYSIHRSDWDSTNFDVKDRKRYY